MFFEPFSLCHTSFLNSNKSQDHYFRKVNRDVFKKVSEEKGNFY